MTLRQVEHHCTGDRVHFPVPWSYGQPEDVMVIVREPSGLREHGLLYGKDFVLDGATVRLITPPAYGARVLLMFHGEEQLSANICAHAENAPTRRTPREGRGREIVSSPASRSVAPVETASIRPAEQIDDYDEENDPVLKDDVERLVDNTKQLAEMLERVARTHEDIRSRVDRLEHILAALGEQAEAMAKEHK